MIALDTTFVIDFLNGEKNALEKADEFKDQRFAVTPISVFEVFLGINLNKRDEREYNVAKELFDGLELLPITMNASEQSAKIQADLSKAGKVMGASDVLIAGTCITHGCTKILTRDKSFSKVNGIEVIEY